MREKDVICIEGESRRRRLSEPVDIVIVNKTGPNIEPWDTPEEAWHGAERHPETEIIMSGVKCKVGAKPTK